MDRQDGFLGRKNLAGNIESGKTALSKKGRKEIPGSRKGMSKSRVSEGPSKIIVVNEMN